LLKTLNVRCQRLCHGRMVLIALTRISDVCCKPRKRSLRSFGLACEQGLKQEVRKDCLHVFHHVEPALQGLHGLIHFLSPKQGFIFNMARKPSQPATAPATIIDIEAVDQLSSSANALVAAGEQQQALVRAIAARLGYMLPADATDPDLIERDIASNMRRSVEACLEVGKGLAVLKAACPHGTFMSRLEVLGIEGSVARRFIQAATKFANRALTHDLTKAIGSQTKLFEMLLLDDEQIEELAELGQTGELKLDDVATMSVKELRAAVREERAERQAGEQVRADLVKKVAKLQTQVKRVEAQEPDVVLAELTKEAQGLAMEALGMLRGQVRAALQALADHQEAHEGGGAVTVTMAGMVGQLQAELAALREQFDLPDVSNAADEQLQAEVDQWAKA
jgi:hypothetical protein